jgi:hypothetical protein
VVVEVVVVGVETLHQATSLIAQVGKKAMAARLAHLDQALLEVVPEVMAAVARPRCWMTMEEAVLLSFCISCRMVHGFRKTIYLLIAEVDLYCSTPFDLETEDASNTLVLLIVTRLRNYYQELLHHKLLLHPLLKVGIREEMKEEEEEEEEAKMLRQIQQMGKVAVLMPLRLFLLRYQLVHLRILQAEEGKRERRTRPQRRRLM